MTKLVPCKNCGNLDDLIIGHDVPEVDPECHYVYCDGCDTEACADTKDEAVAKWNAGGVVQYNAEEPADD